MDIVIVSHNSCLKSPLFLAHMCEDAHTTQQLHCQYSGPCHAKCSANSVQFVVHPRLIDLLMDDARILWLTGVRSVAIDIVECLSHTRVTYIFFQICDKFELLIFKVWWEIIHRFLLKI